MLNCRALTAPAFLVCCIAPPCLAAGSLVAGIHDANGAMAVFRHQYISSFPEYRILARSAGVRPTDALPSLGLLVALLAMGCAAVCLIWKEQNPAATMMVIGFVVALCLFWIALTWAATPIQQCFQRDPCPLDLQSSQSHLAWAPWLVVLSGVVGVLTIALLNLDDVSPPPTNARIKSYG